MLNSCKEIDIVFLRVGGLEKLKDEANTERLSINCEILSVYDQLGKMRHRQNSGWPRQNTAILGLSREAARSPNHCTGMKVTTLQF
jgi:hypothetical protein